MKKYNIDDNLDFWKYSWKPISWLLNNKWDYIDWCYKNIDDFVITNNNKLIDDSSYEIELLESDIRSYKKYITYLKEKYLILDNKINIYKEKEPVIYDKKNNLYYNIFLDTINNNEKIDNDWFQFKKLSYQSKYYDLHNDKIINELDIKYKDTNLIINLNDLFISKNFIEDISYPQKHSWPDDFQATSAVLHTIDKKIYTITSWVLNMEEVGEKLYSRYKRIWWSREDWDFEYGSRPFSYIKDEDWFESFKKNECKEDESNDIPF